MVKCAKCGKKFTKIGRNGYKIEEHMYQAHRIKSMNKKRHLIEEEKS